MYLHWCVTRDATNTVLNPSSPSLSPRRGSFVPQAPPSTQAPPILFFRPARTSLFRSHRGAFISGSADHSLVDFRFFFKSYF